MAKFRQIKFDNPKMTKSEMAKQLSFSTSTLKRYKNESIRFHHTNFSQISPINNQKRL